MFLAVLRDTARFYRQHGFQLVGLSVVIIVITLATLFAAAAVFRAGPHVMKVALLIQWVSAIWLGSASIVYANAVHDGHPITFLSAVHKSMAFITPLFVYQVLLSVCAFIIWLPIVIAFPNLPELAFNLCVMAILFYLGSRLIIPAIIECVLNQADVIYLIRSAWRNSVGIVWILLTGHLAFLGLLALLYLAATSVKANILLLFGLIELLPILTIVPLNIFIFFAYTSKKRPREGQSQPD